MRPGTLAQVRLISAAREAAPALAKLPVSERVRAIADYRWTDAEGHEASFLTEDELKNLTIRAGTLTAEERFKIAEHVIQTILLLEQLPLPHHLRQVPALAGAHHETLRGTGYVFARDQDR